MDKISTAVVSAGVLTILAPAAVTASDLESRVKYNQMRTNWAIQDGKARIEESRKRMQERREERLRSSSSHSTATYGSGNSSTHSSLHSSSSSSHQTIPTVQVQAAGNGLNWYTNREFNFRILFKGTPKVGSQPGPAGTTCNTFSYSNDDGATMIGVTELPVEASGAEQINRSLNGACDGAIKASSCVETARYSCSINGYPGRELSANIPGKGKMKSRLYLVRKKLYQVTVVGVPSFVDGTYSQQFLKSFSLL